MLMEKRMNTDCIENGSLYMTLDAFYRPVYLSMRGQGEERFARYISNNVIPLAGSLSPTIECSVLISGTSP